MKKHHIRKQAYSFFSWLILHLNFLKVQLCIFYSTFSFL